jgi:hypothetical protein
MKMTFEFLPPHHLFDRLAVLQEMQVIVGEIEDRITGESPDGTAAHVPFRRHDPIKHRSAGWDFVEFQRDLIADVGERAPQAVAGYAAANWKQGFNMCVESSSVIGHVQGSNRLQGIGGS